MYWSNPDPNVIDLIHVGQPFLNVNVRYHCPIYGIFKVPKTLHTCFKRRIWLYDRGNYNQYREKLQRVDWDELINSGNSLDDLCESSPNVILQAAGESIPNKIITVRKTDPPWMNGAIRRVINSQIEIASNQCKRLVEIRVTTCWAKLKQFCHPPSKLF